MNGFIFDSIFIFVTDVSFKISYKILFIKRTVFLILTFLYIFDFFFSPPWTKGKEESEGTTTSPKQLSPNLNDESGPSTSAAVTESGDSSGGEGGLDNREQRKAKRIVRIVF